jgi:hypothetical protein
MEPILFKRFSSIPEAEMAKDLLAQQGIKSFVQKGGLQYPGDSGDIYGASLFISQKDFDQAKDILSDIL